ncbi:predicted protein [Sclerotinia sclerotiorum 1980 UF-70]|uniref:Uncharacterized protein n=2 Tax=Sclerotinia sclerotiorum (strain ATCC 18683 / 1980 / Ss-1) TaxID=665079 RepID=A7E855_SCLS1|nr:predicted protein [Sclerotinia sclerotiorum 1980 UF-70]APA06085.1 hypothetical protein sscle_01g008550 [Sclerotinia sclerotiorum 1980 UF-70]EDN96557.1 predicted protein [Sclerotinia sclerotiorum 1980 UF-70]
MRDYPYITVVASGELKRNENSETRLFVPRPKLLAADASSFLELTLELERALNKFLESMDFSVRREFGSGNVQRRMWIVRRGRIVHICG